MASKILSRLALAAALTALMLVPSMTAIGADSKPAPTCAGLAFKDPSGDTDLNPLVSTGIQTPDNTDIIAGWLDTSAEDVTTANIQVANLDKSNYDLSTGTSWYFYFNIGADTYFVRAEIDSSGAELYEWGDLGVTAPGNNGQGTTKGHFFEGKDGVVQIVVPLGALKLAEGKTMKGPYAVTRINMTLPGAGGLVPSADEGPNGSQAGEHVGLDYTIAKCASGAAPGSTAAALAVKIGSKGGSAATATKKKAFSLAIKSSEKVTGLKGNLYAGKATKGKVLATGKVASLDGKGKLPMKVSGKLKKGSYTLLLKGTTAAGTKAKTTAKIKFT